MSYRPSFVVRGFFFLGILSLAASAAQKSVSIISSSSSSYSRIEGTKEKVDPSSGLLKVSQINSCSTIDRIPWVSKTSGKRTRKIFTDTLRLDREKIFSTWELYQVLSESGDVSFIFQRLRKDGKEEYIAAKGDITERIMEVRKGRRRLIDKQNMKPLINRVALSMIQKDGGRVEFIPGQTGKSTIVLYPTNDLGVALAPVYLKGISCDKPESFSDDDISSKDLGQRAKEANLKDKEKDKDKDKK
jgi:hypothetical protein